MKSLSKVIGYFNSNKNNSDTNLDINIFLDLLQK